MYIFFGRNSLKDTNTMLSGEETYGVFSDGLFAGGASHGGLRGIFNTDSTTTNGYSVASTAFEATAVK